MELTNVKLNGENVAQYSDPEQAERYALSLRQRGTGMAYTEKCTAKDGEPRDVLVLCGWGNLCTHSFEDECAKLPVGHGSWPVKRMTFSSHNDNATQFWVRF